MTTATGQTFAVFFSVNFEHKREGDRMVLLRRYLDSGFGPGIEIVDEAMVTENAAYPFVVVARAPSRADLQAALAPCDGVYTLTICEAEVAFNSAVTRATHCVYVLIPSDITAALSARAVTTPDSVTVRTHIELAAGAPCAGIWLVHAPTNDDARRYVMGQRPGTVVAAMNMSTGATFFENKFGAKPAAAPEPPPIHVALAKTADFAIKNEGPTAVAVRVYDPGTTLIQRSNYTALNSGETYRSSGNVYVYSSLPGKAPYWTTSGAQTVPTNYPVPALSFVYQQGGHTNFDIDNPGSTHQVSDLATLLSDLAQSPKYDAPWLEDSYSGEHKDAYDYILRQLRSAPKLGSVSGDLVLVIDYPAGKNFSEAVFLDVRKHLVEECVYFADLQLWYGSNGIFAQINAQIAISFQAALTSAQALMSIQPEQTILMEVLDTVFSDIAAIVGAIPVYGNAIAAVINVGWSIAKIVVDASNPNQSDTPLVVTVAQLSDTMLKYLAQQTDSVSTQHHVIGANWGRLKQFGIAKESGQLSEEKFDVNVGSDRSVGLSPGYIQAAGDAWSIIIYKAMFAAIHRAKAMISFSDTYKVPNPWNPATGNYNYRYVIYCTYDNGTKDPRHQGYCVMDCTTDAPRLVLQKLFGPGPGALNIDPVDFFAGYSGWPAIVPVIPWGKPIIAFQWV